MEFEGHITLPVSALKKEAGRVFDALTEGCTVYVSKYGEVVAAFRPDVPGDLVAAYALPQLATNELTARDMQRGVPTAAVNDAAGGLPSLVTRDHKVYGVLVPAVSPAAPAAQDIDLQAAEANAERMNTFLRANPDASIDEIARYRDELDAGAGGTNVAAAAAAPAAADSAFPRLRGDEINKAWALWRQRGSEVEGTAMKLLERDDPVSAADMTKQLRAWQNLLSNPPRVFKEGAKLATTDPVAEREVYVALLVVDPDQRAAMWKLGDVARREGYRWEAAQWYRHAVADVAVPPLLLDLKAAGEVPANRLGKSGGRRPKPTSRARPVKRAAKKPQVDPAGTSQVSKAPAKFAVRPRDRVRP